MTTEYFTTRNSLHTDFQSVRMFEVCELPQLHGLLLACHHDLQQHLNVTTTERR